MPERKNTPARIKANNRYNDKAYDRINVAIPKGQKATVERAACKAGESVNGYVNGAILQRMGLPDWGQAEPPSQECTE
jgi:hypothetical protein